MAELIFENEHLGVYFSPGIKPYCMFVMGHMLYRTRSQYWAQVPIEKLGIPTVGIVAKKAHWYPQTTMLECLPLIAERLRPYERRVGYGFSMGAYGLVRYGQAVGLTDLLAFSPQLSIDPRLVGSVDQRYVQYFDKTMNRGERAASISGIRTALVYDPLMLIDTWHAQQIDRECRAQHIHVKGVGHQTIDAMVATERLDMLLHKALATDYKAIEADLRNWKKTTLSYRAWLAERLLFSDRTRQCKALIDDILTQEPKHQLALKLQASLALTN